MRVAITGDRNWGDYTAVEQALSSLTPETDHVILGDCPTGADADAQDACNVLGLSYTVHRADWRKHGRAAGPIRNRAMLNDGADEVWFFHLDLWNSKGTKNCVEQAQRLGITVRSGLSV